MHHARNSGGGSLSGMRPNTNAAARKASKSEAEALTGPLGILVAGRKKTRHKRKNKKIKRTRHQSMQNACTKTGAHMQTHTHKNTQKAGGSWHTYPHTHTYTSTCTARTSTQISMPNTCTCNALTNT